MKILITGAGGMVGKNILENLEISSYKVLAPTRRELDLLDGVAVEEYMKLNRPNVVVHCAGLVGGIQANIKAPVRFLIENMEMGKNVLLSARNSKVGKVINMGSSCMYPKDSNELLREEAFFTGPLEPTNEGYALAKIMTMRLGQYLNKEINGNNFKTLIPCNLYGRWDKFSEANSHMLPAVIRKIHNAIKNKERSVEIWGTGEARREFMFCEDLVDFVFFALKNWEKIPEVVNVGLGRDYSIKDYYVIIADTLGYSGSFHHDLTKPEGMKQKVVDVSKANALGWKAKTSLQDGIKKTYEFYIQKENI